MSDPDNVQHAYRHALRALEDFETLHHQRHDRGDDRGLWHSLSHHLRHAVWRIRQEATE